MTIKLLLSITLLTTNLIPFVLCSKIKLTFDELGVPDENNPLTTLEIDTEEDNRQKMKGVLKDIRSHMLKKFKKNKKTRREKGNY